MTDDVAALVLRNNYLQPLSISLAEQQGVAHLGFQQRLMQTLEAKGLLDRAVEFLPDDLELEERRRRSQSLTRPELAVLLAYAKLELKDELLESDVPDDPYLARELGRYFPAPVVGAVPRRAGTAPAAARDHHHPARQFDHQSWRAVVRGADRGPDRCAVRQHRVGFRRRARQLRHDRAQHRDRRRSTTRFPASSSSTSTPPCSGCCATAWSGSCAMSISPRGLPASSRTIVTASPLWRRRSTLRSSRRRRRRSTSGPGNLQLPVYRRNSRAGSRACRCSPPRPTSCWSPSAPANRSPDVAATYFAAEAFFQLDRIARAARQIRVSDYFDRLALDRALDAIGDAERRLTAAMAGNGLRAQRRSRPGSRRGKPTSIASARRSRRSQVRG